jgi:hypothetical protein
LTRWKSFTATVITSPATRLLSRVSSARDIGVVGGLDLGAADPCVPAQRRQYDKGQCRQYRKQWNREAAPEATWLPKVSEQARAAETGAWLGGGGLA